MLIHQPSLRRVLILITLIYSAQSRAQHQEPSRAQHQEPSRAQHQEPSRAQHQEPSRAQHQEPSRAQHQEPSRAQHQEPSRAQHQEPSRAQHQEPSRAQRSEIKIRVIDLGSTRDLNIDLKMDQAAPKELRRGWLGVECEEQEVTYQGAQSTGLHLTQVFTSGPAHRAGLRRGDLLLKLNHKEISHEGLYSYLSYYSKRSISLSYLRLTDSGLTAPDELKDHNYTEPDLLHVDVVYRTNINKLVAQTLYLLGSLDRHHVELRRISSPDKLPLISALLDDGAQFKCKHASRELKLLNERREGVASAPNKIAHPQRPIFKLQVGDLIVFEGLTQSLIASYGGSSKCINHSNKWIGSKPTRHLIKLIDELTLDYRQQELRRLSRVKDK